MPDKRMRPIVKQEPGADGAQELPPLQQQQVAAAREQDVQRRMAEDERGEELQLQLLRANAQAQAFALQGMERERAMGEELLQAKAQIAEVRAEVAVLESKLQSKEAVLQATLQSKDAVIAANIAVIEAKDALIRRMQREQRRDDAPAAAGASASSSSSSAAAAAASPSLGRYAAAGKHMVSAAPQPAAPTS
jgi:hypothetical protein